MNAQCRLAIRHIEPYKVSLSPVTRMSYLCALLPFVFSLFGLIQMNRETFIKMPLNVTMAKALLFRGN